MTTSFAPGSWPVIYPQDCQAFQYFGDSGFPDQMYFEAAATEMLWNWTQRIFGTEEVTVRPCKDFKPRIAPPSSFEGLGPWSLNPGFGSGHSTVGWPGVGYWLPVLVNGLWYNLYCGQCGSDYCHCEPDQMKVLSLPGPVVSVSSVKVNGAVLDPSAYWVRDNRWLTRSDGGNWALTQDFTQPDDSNNTWSVTYEKGVVVPVGGQIAAGTLACELAKAYAQDASCALPSRMQSVSREGVDVAIIEQAHGGRGAVVNRAVVEIPKSSTGIWVIDSWVEAVNVPRYSVSVRSVDATGTRRWKY